MTYISNRNYQEKWPLPLQEKSPESWPTMVDHLRGAKQVIPWCCFTALPSRAGGSILDKTDICEDGIARSQVKDLAIPQDPVLFIGTVQLDPFDEQSDESIWRALERTHMKDKISKLDHQLMAPVIENGENFSVGERQLMCMARALLRNSKILFLDEATAAIDSETDTLIQATIREAFRDCTMLTIAHRLNTIVDSHRILVMDDGKIAEFDRPSALMNKPNSIFKSMMEAVAAQKELAEVFGSANSLQVPSPI
nr:ATP-binding cassette sub-family C member 12-like [Lytechinus pictus]